MESTSSSNTNTSTATSQQTTTKLDKDSLWKHMTKVVKLKERGGNTKIRCNLCNAEFTGLG